MSATPCGQIMHETKLLFLHPTEILDSEDEQNFLTRSFNSSDKSKELLDADFVNDDISDAESKDSKSDEDIEHNNKETVPKKEASDSSSDDELEGSQQPLYR